MSDKCKYYLEVKGFDNPQELVSVCKCNGKNNEIAALREALTLVERENECMKQSIQEACDYLNRNRFNQIEYGSSIHIELRRHI